jgi:hypothetical protein
MYCSSGNLTVSPQATSYSAFSEHYANSENQSTDGLVRMLRGPYPRHCERESGGSSSQTAKRPRNTEDAGYTMNTYEQFLGFESLKRQKNC